MPLQISIDALWIVRTLLGLLWGIGYALFLQMTRSGRQLAVDLTWLSVVIGVGIDMLISFGASYFTVLSVITASAIGIIIRSLYNESHGTNHPYKAIGEIEDATANIAAIISVLQGGLENGTQPSAAMSRTLGLAHKAHEHLRTARQSIVIPGLSKKAKS